MQPDPEFKPPKEYADERDMEAFWAAAEIDGEPAHKPSYGVLIVVFVLFGVPWYFSAGHLGRMIGGLPLWIWMSLASSFGLACLTAIGVLRYWRDGHEDDG